MIFIMVGLNGLEPSTSRLSGVRSNQPSYRPTIFLEWVKGIEPSSSAWKAEVLPLNYTRMYKRLGGGVQATPGFEPGNGGFADLCLTTWLCCHGSGLEGLNLRMTESKSVALPLAIAL